MTTGASSRASVSIALVHYPVYDKNKRTVATAVTNLDVHDIARAAKTFGAHKFFIVTPLQERKILVERITRHWQQGWGSEYNPKRKAALDLVRYSVSLNDAVAELEMDYGVKPKTIATGATAHGKSLSYREMRRILESGESSPFLLIFGTGWGLHEEVVTGADFFLSPVSGPGSYNHLSVRSAVSIILDRLFGDLCS